MDGLLALYLRLFDWECGARDSRALQWMLCRLQRWNVAVYFADHWEACAEFIFHDLLVQTKAESYGVVRGNFWAAVLVCAVS